MRITDLMFEWAWNHACRQRRLSKRFREANAIVASLVWSQK